MTKKTFEDHKSETDYRDTDVPLTFIMYMKFSEGVCSDDLYVLSLMLHWNRYYPTNYRVVFLLAFHYDCYITNKGLAMQLKREVKLPRFIISWKMSAYGISLFSIDLCTFYLYVTNSSIFQFYFIIKNSIRNFLVARDDTV